MNKPLISLVIPCYNSAAYIGRCLDSLFVHAPPAGTIEVICVEDGSSDNTLALLQEYAQQQPITVIALAENAGLSVARNTGAQAAQGSYVWFVDSDDFLLPDAWSTVLTLVRQQPGKDMYAIGYQTTRGSHVLGAIVNKGPFRLLGRSGLIRGGAEIARHTFARQRFFVWNKILRKEIWLRHPFPPGQSFEDITAVANAVFDCQECAWVRDSCLHYFVRSDSITGSMSPKACHDLFWSLQDFRSRFLNSTLVTNRSLHFYVASFVLKHCLDAICHLLIHNHQQGLPQEDALGLLAQLPQMLIEPMQTTQRRRLLRLHKNFRTDARFIKAIEKFQPTHLPALLALAHQRQKKAFVSASSL